MQKSKQLIITFMMMLTCLFLIGVRVSAASEQTGYITGTNEAVSWSYDSETKTLTITGHGERVCTDTDWSHGIPSDVWYIRFNDCEISGSMKGFFSRLGQLREIDFTGLTMKNVTDMSHMFEHCNKLTTWDLSSFNTEHVTDMSYMFESCDKLTELDLSSFDTGKVLNMEGMFDDCHDLKTVNVSGFDTGNVTNMKDMFGGCIDLETLDVSSFDTSSVTDMTAMFRWCFSLKTLDLSGFDTRNVTDMASMFTTCEDLEMLDVSSFDTRNVTDMAGMFIHCADLKTLDVSSFDTGNVTSMRNMFMGCASLKTLDVSNFDTSNVTDMGSMFESCSGLKNLNVSSFNTGKVRNMRSMFNYCRSLESLDVSNFDTVNVNNMMSMFANCTSLKSIDVSGFDTVNVNDMTTMFIKCSSLERLDLSSFCTSSVSDITGMFSDCTSLRVLDISGFELQSIESSFGVAETEFLLLEKCTALQYLYTPKDMGDITITLPDVFYNGTTSVSVMDSSVEGVVLTRTCGAALPADRAQVEAFAERMYTVALGREAEKSGLAYWTDKLVYRETDGAAISVGFIMSEEFFSKGYTNRDYVTVLYRTFFNREPDEGGMAYWLEKLSERYSRGYVLAGFVNSLEFDTLCKEYGINRGVLIPQTEVIPEGIYGFVERTYLYSLDREGDEGGIEYWVQRIAEKMVQPVDTVKAFFLSPEYEGKGTSDEDYIRAMYKTFMNREADASGLAFWQDFLQNENTRAAVMDNFAASAEFKGIMAEYGL